MNGKLVNLSAVLVAVDKNATAAGDVAAQAFGNAAEANTTASSALSTANAALNQTTIALQTITNVSITLSKQFNDKLALCVLDFRRCFCCLFLCVSRLIVWMMCVQAHRG